MEQRGLRVGTIADGPVCRKVRPIARSVSGTPVGLMAQLRIGLVFPMIDADAKVQAQASRVKDALQKIIKFVARESSHLPSRSQARNKI